MTPQLRPRLAPAFLALAALLGGRSAAALPLLSEVLYYFTEESAAALADRVLRSLNPEGLVLLVHWTGPTDALCTGDEATARFLDVCGPAVTPMLHTREPQYRLDLLRSSP